MRHVSELGVGDTYLAYDVMVQLRPNAGTVEEFVQRIDSLQRPEGYRLVASFAGSVEVAGVAGFRLGHNLAWGSHMYVDDLVTAQSARSQGHGSALIEWLVAEARKSGCRELHLDSGVQRFGAHRFYLRERMDITSHHFALVLD